MTTKQMLLSALILSTIGNITLATEKTREQRKQKLLNKKLLETAAYGKVKKIKQLIEDGAEINAKDKYGYTPLHNAACHRNIKVVKQLIKDGAEINAKNNFGRTALHEVSEFFYPSKEKLEIASELIKNGIDLDAQNYRGRTAAHEAAYHCNHEMLQLMYENDANLTKKTGYLLGNTPLDIAREKNSQLQSTLDKQQKKYTTLECNENDELCSELQKKISTSQEAIYPCQATLAFLEKTHNKKQ